LGDRQLGDWVNGETEDGRGKGREQPERNEKCLLLSFMFSIQILSKTRPHVI